MTPKIAIVGAGLAGLACARRLAAAGAQVTLFEKSRGVGGRCATRRSECGPFHHGAPSFAAHDPAFRAEVARWQAAGWVRPGPRAGTWVGWPTMNTLARQLADGLHVVTETTVTALERDSPAAGHDGGAWRLRCAEAGAAPRGAFDAVVVAAPAEQAVALTQASVQLQRWLHAVRSQPCWTLMLAWPEGAAPVAMPPLPADGPLALGVDCSALPQPPDGGSVAGTPAVGTRWTLHARADWSGAHLEAAPAMAAEAMLQALRTACPAAQPLPAPTHAVAHRWRYAQVAAPAAAPFGWDAALRLGCCGDAWQGAPVPAGPTLPDGIERAWLSGVGLADGLRQALDAPAPRAA